MKDYPLIKFTILFILGIYFQSLINADSIILLTALATLLAIIFLLIFYTKNNPKLDSQIYLTSIPGPLLFAITILILLLGSTYYSVSNLNSTEYPFEKNRITNAEVYGEIINIDLRKENEFKFQIEADSVQYKGKHITLKTILYCKVKLTGKWKESVLDSLSVGNYVKITGAIQKGRERRNPYEFDYNAYLNSKGIAGLLYIKKVNDIIMVDDNTAPIKNLIYRVREIFASRISNFYNSDAAALVKGLILADRSGIDYSTKEYFVNAGVIHVLAVSGLHVGFIVFFFFIMFNRLNIYVRYFATIAGLFFFVVITGAPPSVLRAAIMASILIISLISNRGYGNINSLALAALILLIIDPNELFNPGFQLSFSAVLSILIFYPKFKTRLDSFAIKSVTVKNILLFAAVSLSAQIGTLPFTLTYFHKLSVISILANLFVIPLIGVIVGLAIISLLAGLISSWMAITFSSANELAISLLYWLVDTFGRFEYAYLFIRQFTFYDTIIFYFSLMVLYYSRKYLTSKIIKTSFMVLFICVVYLFMKIDDVNLLEDNKLNVVMIDIGQGDSIFLQFPNGKTAIIDGGNATEAFDNGERVIYPLLRNLGIDRINYCFISHMDADHYKGLESLLAKDIIDTVYKPIPDTSNKHDLEFEEFVNNIDIPVLHYHKGVIKIGGSNVYILNDSTSAIYRNMNSNNKSGIIKIVFGETSFLFVGDAERPAERMLQKRFGRFLSADLLKAGHHGSITSSSNNFLDLVDPKYVLISAGQFNKFNHPSKVIIDRLNSRGIEIKRTDLEGAIILRSDGENISFVDWR